MFRDNYKIKKQALNDSSTLYNYFYGDNYESVFIDLQLTDEEKKIMKFLSENANFYIRESDNEICLKINGYKIHDKSKPFHKHGSICVSKSKSKIKPRIQIPHEIKIINELASRIDADKVRAFFKQINRVNYV